ncbi:hypothetical protein AB2L27_06705 [Kineococcus sp. LSe6-4]|uniref:Ricin B lectin domain-containing protein n=1 Tax=Kineococcus halophytocola TaxID=3234027 RepID=A0ABV4GZG4_9ACTN
MRRDDVSGDGTGDGMGERIGRAADEAAQGARLPSAAEVMRRGDRRRRRTRTTRAAAVALVVAVGGGGWWLTQDGPERGVPAPPASATATATPSPTSEDPAPGPTPSPPEATFTAPDGSVLTTRTEPGAELAAPAEVAGPTMPLWSADPAATPGRYLLRNGAPTDGRDVCLSAPLEDAVSTEVCDPAATGQQFEVTRDGSGSWTLRTDVGFVSADADGVLTTTTDPAAATRFTVTAGDDAAPWTPGD